MRVCLASYEYPPQTADGGIGTQTWNKAHGLSRLGHQVEVLSCAGHKIAEPVSTACESGISVHRLRRPGDDPDQETPLYEQAAFLYGYSWSVLTQLDRMQRDKPFDIVNFPEYGADGFAFLLNRTIHNWLPAVVQLHGPIAMLSERTGWPEEGGSFYRTAVFMERESIRLADGWMASSANIADFAAEFYGVPRERMHVVHCGIDCEQFHPPSARDESKRPTVLFVGNVTLSKGVETVFDAVARLRTSFPGIRLVIVGKGDSRERLKARAERDGLQQHVEFVPFVADRSEITRLYQDADVFASPSDHEGGVANTYVEAMACGCPVIASTSGGAVEAVCSGETGLLVPPRDVAATVAAIGHILGDQGQRAKMASAARQRAVEYFAQDRYIARVIAAYEQTIEHSRRRLAQLREAAG